MKKKTELPEVEPVKLGPIFGVRPGVIILSGLIAAAVLLFFVLFILPGLLSGTGYVRFSTNTVNTAIITEDGKYIGSSEGSVYRLPSGSYSFGFYIDGVYAGTVEAEVPHRIFFTLFRHKTDTITFSAENSPEIEEAVTETFTEGTAAWSAVLDYGDDYHFPPLFSDFAKNAAALGFSDIRDALLYGAMHITSETMYEDYKAALSVLAESGVEYSSPELESLNAFLASSYDGSFASPIPGENEMIRGEYEDGFFRYEENAVSMGTETDGSYPACMAYPVTLTVPSFSIAQYPVTEYEYALFVSENPYWSRSNTEKLVEDGMADSGYLDGITLSASIMSARPIRNISYYAAEAYCRWLSEKTGKTVRLPSEAEWYEAALSTAEKPYVTSLVHFDSDSSAPSAMMGQLWEMTSTPFIPLMRAAGYEKAIELSALYPYDGIIVKGGSYINSPSDVTAENVGVVDKAATSPFVGFRVAIE